MGKHVFHIHWKKVSACVSSDRKSVGKRVDRCIRSWRRGEEKGSAAEKTWTSCKLLKLCVCVCGLEFLCVCAYFFVFDFCFCSVSVRALKISRQTARMWNTNSWLISYQQCCVQGHLRVHLINFLSTLLCTTWPQAGSIWLISYQHCYVQDRLRVQINFLLTVLCTRSPQGPVQFLINIVVYNLPAGSFC